MERRDFLTGAAGAISVPLIGCSAATQNTPARTLSDAETEAIVAHLSRTLGATNDVRLVSEALPDLARSGDTALRARLDEADALARVGLRSLLIGDAGGMVPRDARPSERLAQHFAQHAPVLDDSLVGYTALFERAPVREKQRMNALLREHHDVPMRVGEALDTHARTIGVTGDSRGKMRRILSDVAARSRAQSLSVVTDECVEKVHRVAAQRGESAALASAVAAQLAAAAFWMPIDGAPAQAADNERPPPAAPQSAVPLFAPSASPSWRPPPSLASAAGAVERPGVAAQRVGGWMAGIGATVWGIGWGVGFSMGVDIGIVFLVGGTLGAVAVLVGLIVLIVGTIVRASS